MASENNINKATAKKELSLLLPKIDSIFESEPAVLRINNEPIMIIGDIHGYLQALNSIIKERNEIECKNIIFLGDYVDRGIQGTEVLLRLFQLKIEHLGHIFLLRGKPRLSPGIRIGIKDARRESFALILPIGGPTFQAQVDLFHLNQVL